MQYSSDYLPPGEVSVKCSYNFKAVHRVPVTSGWPVAMWIQSLPKALTHDPLLIKIYLNQWLDYLNNINISNIIITSEFTIQSLLYYNTSYY